MKSSTLVLGQGQKVHAAASVIKKHNIYGIPVMVRIGHSNSLLPVLMIHKSKTIPPIRISVREIPNGF